MEFKKIQISKTNTLNVVFRNGDGDTITMVGGNIVHRDLKEAFTALIPHVVFLTEQREATGATLKELQEQSEWEEKSIFTAIRQAVAAGDYDTASDLKLEMVKTIEELKALYHNYKQNIID